MIEGYNAVTQALLGTLLTWGLTAAGAGLVIFLRGNHVSHVFTLAMLIRQNNAVCSAILEKDARCIAGI
jgi:hypothetical protein